MRIACWSWGALDPVGTESPDAQALTPPPACDNPSRGALPLIELPHRHGALPWARAARSPLQVAKLRFGMPTLIETGSSFARLDPGEADGTCMSAVFGPGAIENRFR
jgi:hypothetical protein